nr:aminoglycoside phosphotransferase family protein [Beutenbergia cavernae]
MEVPTSFRASPRWWHDADGAAWLDALPSLVEAAARRWDLEIDGRPSHGSNALVVPVRRAGEPFALRLTPPGDGVAAEVAALRFWAGRGTVQLEDADVDAGVTLLERLDATRSLASLPLDDAVRHLARLMRRLAVPAPASARSTGDVVRDRLPELTADWERLGQPFERRALDAARDAGAGLTTPAADVAVDGDLHHEQVLAGTREPWLAVDPVLLRGDVEYDLARILWTRLDEMADDDVPRHVRTVVEVADLEPERAHAWVLFRTVDYWLWGLAHGLTEDPVRCARIVTLLAG